MSKKFCRWFCAVDAVSRSSSCSRKRTVTRPKSYTSGVELKTVEKKSDVVEMMLDVVEDDIVFLVVFEAYDRFAPFELPSLPV
jgi:hypothetical protein